MSDSDYVSHLSGISRQIRTVASRQETPAQKTAGVTTAVAGVTKAGAGRTVTITTVTIATALTVTVTIAATFTVTTTAAAEREFIPGGIHRPLYADAASVGAVVIAPFYLDARAVTNADYLAFVRAHLRWRKSQVAPLFADRNYLAHWHGDLSPGAATAAAADAPVVNVSWFAARAYCRAAGGRLPSTAQWEFAAAADEESADAADDPAFIARILAWYSAPRDGAGAPHYRNYYGVYDMHASVWEWVSDFNAALTSGESRADASRERQLFCAAGVVGARSYTDYPSFLRNAYRSSLDGRYTHRELGFRCAAAVE